MYFAYAIAGDVFMKQLTWKIYGVWILFTEAVGFLSGWVTKAGTEHYNATVTQPALSPPSEVFPIVWSVLFALMGIGAARIYASTVSKARERGLRIFFLQLAFNFLWSIIFFNLQAFTAAFFWLLALWGLIIGMVISFYKVDPLAAWIQVPYLLWVTFAGYLNFGVWMLNK